MARPPDVHRLLIVRHCVLLRLRPSSRAAQMGGTTLLEFHISSVYQCGALPPIGSAAEDHLAEADAGDGEIDDPDREHRHERLP